MVGLFVAAGVADMGWVEAEAVGPAVVSWPRDVHFWAFVAVSLLLFMSF